MTSFPQSFGRRLAGALSAASVFLGLATLATAQPVGSHDRLAYLRAQTAAVERSQAEGRRSEALAVADRTLSMAASLTNPEAAPGDVARGLSILIEVLARAGEIERAWGLLRASEDGLQKALPAGTPDGAAFRLTRAQLRQQVGDLAGARESVEAALPGLDGERLGQALTLKAGLCAATGDMACAQAALQAHPYAADRAPRSPAETQHLAVRGLVATLARAQDPAVLSALRQPQAFAEGPTEAVYRAAAGALAQPPGPARAAGLAELGGRLRAAALDPRTAGRWSKPGALDQALIALALTQAGAADTPAAREDLFALFQLAGRSGPSFDGDALAVMGQARDELQRRSAHQALRLRARRDRLVRTQIQRVAQRLAQPAAGGDLRHDAGARLLIRDFDVRIREAGSLLAAQGLPMDAPKLTTLARLQAALGQQEAALAVAQTAGGYAYLCVRKDAVRASLAPVDPARIRLDTRLLQSALTAGHAASEALDVQFPVESAVRLHEALIRPFAGCLKAGDRIAWLPGATDAAVPLAALLSAPPPKLAQGWDLAAADWLVKRHAVAYPGSAAALVANRSTVRAGGADFDFLGVGDPVLGHGPATQKLGFLKPLPETRDELEASAQGFARVRLIMGAAATERALRGEMVGAYRYLSFATHGLLREDLQGLSDPALVLTPTAPDDPLDDGLLTASEIADLNLKAAFVALSACNTAAFDATRMAQELPALASAFAVAGTPGVLGTLWPVDSETGKRVVTDVFRSLQAGGTDPAVALAEAQRAFLAAPPGRAWLHPRFWAPFVILGDRPGPASAARGAPGVRAVEVLTRNGGEVLALQAVDGGTAARLISDADARGRMGAGVRLAGRDGAELWRRERHDVGAAQMLVRLGGRLVAGGYVQGPAGRFVPVLEAFGADGAPAAAWRGEGIARVDAMLMAGAQDGSDRAVFGVAELNLRDAPGAGGGRLHVFEVAADLAPRRLFEVSLAPGLSIARATVTPLGERLLVTLTADPRAPRTEAPPDDYDLPACAGAETTYVELRERDGRLVASRALPGLAAATAVAADGRVLLAGSTRADCGERRATVAALDASLAARPLYEDASLGASDVRALALLPGGRVFAAASKENVVEYRPPAVARAAGANPFTVMPFPHTYSGLVLTLDSRGRASPVKLLDSGSNIYVTAALASGAQVLLGGAVAGQAALFRLDAPR